MFLLPHPCDQAHGWGSRVSIDLWQRWSGFDVERVTGLLYRVSGGYLFEGDDERADFGQALFDGRSLEGGLVICLAGPDFGDPEDVLIGSVLGDDKAETAGDGVGVFTAHEVDEFVAAAGGGGEFHDETVHAGPRRRCGQGCRSNSAENFTEQGVGRAGFLWPGDALVYT
jgi:hypothetical protein